MDRTVILIKPDAIKARVAGQIITRLEKEGFTLLAAKFVRLTDRLLTQWYAHHKDKPFFPELQKFMKETPVLAMLWQGENIIEKVRILCGPTDSKLAAKGTIRGDFGTDIQRNAIHASENKEAAERETELMFQPDEIHK